MDNEDDKKRIILVYIYFNHNTVSKIPKWNKILREKYKDLLLVSVEQYDSCWMPGFGSVEGKKNEQRMNELLQVKVKQEI